MRTCESHVFMCAPYTLCVWAPKCAQGVQVLRESRIHPPSNFCHPTPAAQAPPPALTPTPAQTPPPTPHACAPQVLLTLPLVCAFFPLDAAASILDGSLLAAKQTDYMSFVQVGGCAPHCTPAALLAPWGGGVHASPSVARACAWPCTAVRPPQARPACPPALDEGCVRASPPPHTCLPARPLPPRSRPASSSTAYSSTCPPTASSATCPSGPRSRSCPCSASREVGACWGSAVGIWCGGGGGPNGTGMLVRTVGPCP